MARLNESSNAYGHLSKAALIDKLGELEASLAELEQGGGGIGEDPPCTHLDAGATSRDRVSIIELLHNIAIAANQAQGADEAMRSCLDAVCAYMGWPVGHVYLRARAPDDKLVPTNIWHLDDPARFATFKKVTQATTFAPGVGLPGRVLANGEPAWIIDVTKDPNFPRARLAEELGVRAGFAFPVRVGSRVEAVLEFFAPTSAEPDADLLQVLDNIAVQIGRVVERSNAEAALREREGRFRSLVENIPGVTYRCLLDDDWTMQFIGGPVEQMTGYPLSDFLSNSVRSFGDLILAEDAVSVTRAVTRAVAAGRDFTLEYRIVRKDGEIRWVMSKGQPVFDDQGELKWLDGTLFDVTERKQAQESLARQSRVLANTLDAIDQGIVMVDEDLSVVSYNKQFIDLFGLPRDTFEVDPSFASLHRKRLPSQGFSESYVKKALDRLYRREPLVFEAPLPDGRTIEVHHLPRDDGSFVRTYSDITERKKAEAEVRGAKEQAETALQDLQTAQRQLIQSEKMASLGQLTAGIAHEIKNPLNFVNGFSEVSVEMLEDLAELIAPARSTLSTDAQEELDELLATTTQNLEWIQEHARRADSIVKNMLLHSRGDAGVRRATDINPLAEENLKLAYHGIRAKQTDFNAKFESDLDETAGSAVIAPQEIGRVLLNLFNNGFYAVHQRKLASDSPKYQPTLSVTTHGRDDEIEIRVRDNGTGIPKSVVDKIFNPFFTTKPAGQGTGLGLSLSYDIVAAHGGTLSVDSVEGDYSEFILTLPRGAAATNGKSAAEPLP